jgi:peptidoglycan/xylan/chitin deacetylase (PgdA/CDA1 family)
MKDILKFLVFRIVAPVLLFCRFDLLLRRYSGNDRMIIFLHGVTSSKNHQINGRHMDAGQFEKFLIYLKTNFEILPVEELCKQKGTGKPVSRKKIALSFDDGFHNNVDVALPLLVKHGIPATFFVSSACLHDPHYIHPPDLIDLLKAGLTKNEVTINGEKFQISGDELVRTNDGKTLLEYVNNLSFDELRSTMAAIKSTYGYDRLTQDVDAEYYRLVSGDDLRAIDSNGLISIGSHSHYHVAMNVLSEAEIKEQLELSRTQLQQCSTRPVRSFAFPYGYFRQGDVDAAINHGFEYIFAAGSVAPGDGEVFPRIGILSMRGFAFNILSINSGFNRFGF